MTAQRDMATLAAYNGVLARAGFPHRQRRGRKALAEAKAVADWCEAEDIGPVEPYMAARQEALSHAGVHVAVTLRKLARATPSFLAQYREWGAQRQAAAAGQRALVAATEPDTDRLGSELRVLWESMKQAYSATGDQVVCRLSIDVTGGYNPQSPHCGACPEREACWKAVPEQVRRSRVRSV